MQVVLGLAVQAKQSVNVFKNQQNKQLLKLFNRNVRLHVRN